MSYALLSEATRTARKPHRCVWCGEAIAAGEQYTDERSVYDGAVQRHRWHPECLDACREDIRAGGDPEFTLYSNERPAQEPQQ